MTSELKSPDFVAYSSLVRVNANPHFDKVLESLKTHPLSDIPHWISTEKIDGSNLSFQLFKNSISDVEPEIKCFSRNIYLEPNASFNNFQAILKAYKDDLVKIFNAVREKIPDAEIVTVFGEIYGGSFEANKVNGGRYIAYCPQKTFSAFDVLVKKTGAECSEYVDYADFLEILGSTSVPYAKPLSAPATLDAVLATEVENMVSTVCEQYKLKKISGNLAEGIIIRPLREITFMHHKEQTRAVFKKKRQAFTEEQVKQPKNQAPSGDEVATIKRYAEMAAAKVAEARLHNVISHFPAFENKEAVYRKLIPAFINDVIGDLTKDLAGDAQAADLLAKPQAKKAITDAVRKPTTDMINKNIVAILAGTFD